MYSLCIPLTCSISQIAARTPKIAWMADSPPVHPATGKKNLFGTRGPLKSTHAKDADGRPFCCDKSSHAQAKNLDKFFYFNLRLS